MDLSVTKVMKVMHNLPPLNALKAFEATARLLSFTKAAQELNVTRAAVSQQVKSLEHYLDAVLIERRGTQLRLTPAAYDYLPVVSQLFIGLSTTTEHLFTRQRHQQLCLHVAHSFCMQWLMPRLADFRRQHPQISYKLTTTANALPNSSAIADVEVINGYGDWQTEELQRLTIERWIVVASPGFLRLNPINSLAELAHAPRLATGGYRETWQHWFEYHGYQQNISRLVAEFDHSMLAIEAAVNQMGVALVRDLLVEDHLRQGILVQVGQWYMPTEGAHYLLCRNTHKPAANLFCEWLKNSVS